MDTTQLTNDPDFRQLVRDAERLTRRAATNATSIAATAPQDAEALTKTFIKLEKKFQKLQEELADLPEKLTSQQKQKLRGHKQKLKRLQKRAGQELGFTRKEFSLLVTDLGKRSAKLMEKHPELAEASGDIRNTLLAGAAKPVLLTSMNISPLAYVATETEVEMALGVQGLTSQETCQQQCDEDYWTAFAIATGAYLAAATGCMALFTVPPPVGPLLVAGCIAAISISYAGAIADASFKIDRCYKAC